MTALLDFLEPLGAASVALLWAPLLSWTVVWAVAEAALWAGRGGHPAVRYRTAQALVLTLPLGLALAATVDASAFSLRTPALAFIPDPGTAAVASEAAVPVEETGPSSPVSLAALLGVVCCLWAVVAVVRLLRLGGHAVALLRLRRALPVAQVDGLERAVHDAAERVGLRRPVVVVATDADVVPLTFGLWRPLVVVPASLTGGDLRLALVHELVHVRERDALAQWLEALVGAVFWAHPAVPRLLRRCDLLREMACDAAVLSAPDVRRHSYAALVSAFVTPPAPTVPAAVGMADSPPHVHQRLTAMKSLAPSSAPARARWLVAASVLVGGALAVTAGGALAQPAPTPTILVHPVGVSTTTPLVVLDGEVVAGSIEDLDPDQIHSLEVLKGDAARARYGEAGADGVVVVTSRAAAEAQGLPPAPEGQRLHILRAVPDPSGDGSFRASQTEDGPVRVRVSGTRGLHALEAASGAASARGGSSVHLVLPSSDGPAGSPLLVVDGEVAEGSVGDLDPSEIRSISVLKGESARARYGEAGANGVVLVATKAAASGAEATTAPAQAQAASEVAPEFSVRSVHPNPSTGTVAVTFSLPTEAEVRLDVFDVTGRRVQGVQPALTSAGPRQTLQVDTAGLAAGTYLYRLEARAGGRTYTGSGSFSVVR